MAKDNETMNRNVPKTVRLAHENIVALRIGVYCDVDDWVFIIWCSNNFMTSYVFVK